MCHCLRNGLTRHVKNCFRSLVTAIDTCVWRLQVEPIASHSDVFHLLRAKGRGWVLLVSRQYVELSFLSLRIFHTTLSQPLFHTQLSHAPSFFVTHHLSHTALSHTTLHTQLFYFSILHHLLCLFSFLPRPRYNICCSLLEEVDLWGYPVPLIFACNYNGHTYMFAVYSANALAETSSSLFPLCSIQAVFDRCDMDKSGKH